LSHPAISVTPPHLLGKVIFYFYFYFAVFIVNLVPSTPVRRTAAPTTAFVTPSHIHNTSAPVEEGDYFNFLILLYSFLF
jgi:hypothetical protein